MDQPLTDVRSVYSTVNMKYFVCLTVNMFLKPRPYDHITIWDPGGSAPLPLPQGLGDAGGW